MAAYLSGMRWEKVPEEFRGKCAADIRRFRKALREGGYEID
jgi:type VI protein secretion system component VasF